MESSRIIGSGIADVLDVDPAAQVARLKTLGRRVTGCRLLVATY